MSFKNYDSTMYNSHDGIMSTERDQNLSLTDTNILSHSLAHKDLVSPKIWIPISLAVAFMNAVSNEIKSKISAYHMTAIFLVAPSILLGSLFAGCVFGIHSKYFSKSNQIMSSQNSSFFGWIYDIYYVRIQSEDSISENSNKEYKLMMNRIYATIVICFLELVNTFLIFESYYLISSTKVNTGVITTLFCLRIAFISICFYYLFEQKLNLFDYVGMGFCCLCVILIALSKSGFIFNNFSANYILSICIILIVILLQTPRDAIMKYYFCYEENNVNIVAFRVFHDILLYIFYVFIGIIALWNNFSFPTEVIVFSSICGLLHLTASLITNFIIARSMAGPAEALLSMCNSIQIVIDMFLYGNSINIMQTIGLLFSLLSMICIILGNRD